MSHSHYRNLLVLREERHLVRERGFIANLLTTRIAGVRVDFASTAEQAVALAPQADVILTSTFPWLAPVVNAAVQLKWLHFLSAGIDGVWDMPIAHARYILSNSSGIHAAPLSEYVLTAMLYFAKDLPRLRRQQAAREWNRTWLGELDGKCVGIVGLGNIGSAIASRCRALGMQVVGTVRHPRPIEDVDQVYAPDEIGRVLKRADYLVLCAPLTAETQGLMSEARLLQMKPGAVLINIARGAMVDEAALARLLEQGQIAGAVLDAFTEEPLPPSSPFWRLDNVLLTPHVAGTSVRGLERGLELFAENHRLVSAGQPPRSAIARDRGY